ncbi:MAG: DUF2628 domain-containing protein [Oscillospiraceae bacterium]|nr:DUF2628 domain-containing protein [Oscillospiraceae bacterium]
MEGRRVCPYCGKEIRGSEAVTVCPQCGVVHHMSCWEKNDGCCTKGCAASGKYVKDISEIARMQHRKKSEVMPKPQAPKPRRDVPKHTERERVSRAADIPPRPVVQPQVQPQIQPVKIEEQCDEYGFTPKGRMSEKMKSIIQEKLYYYDLKMTMLNLSGGKASWNGSAFVFPLLWFAYRKMYLYALMSGILYAIITFVGMIPIVGGFFNILLTIALHVCAGIFANYIYKYHSEQVFREGADLTPDDQWKFYRKRGGTTKTAVVVTSLLKSLFMILVSILQVVVFANSIRNGILGGNLGYLGDLFEMVGDIVEELF